MSIQRATKVVSFSLVFQFGLSLLCFSQAWIAPKGNGAISLNYQFVQVDNHIFGFGQRLDRGQIFANTAIADFSYSLTDKLSVSVALPFVSSKYKGSNPHRIRNADGTFSITLDDGTYHSAFQDFSFQARYNIATKPFQITPFVRAIIPSHEYPFFAHAAFGVNSRRLQLGTYAGRVLDPIFPNAYLEGRYSYTFREQILDISTNYSSGDLTLGYFVTPSVRIFGIAVGQLTHGGIDLDSITPTVSTNPYFFHHDRITRHNYLNLGGGASYSVNDAIEVYGAVLNTVSGRNTHAVKYGITFGISYGFQGFRPRNEQRASQSANFKPVCFCAAKEAGMK